jgi:predicted AAA+ superfamily ATPase
MKRAIYSDLLRWKNTDNRKPLLLQGARQVGKTYLINQFGKQEYSHFIYLNFEQNPEIRSLFIGTLNPEIIINNISLYIGKKIVSDNTLIFFDEIQAAEEALTSLKYFYEQQPEYHIIAAGSLLGISVGKNRSFPVGKVSFMYMYPLSFSEYLVAVGEEFLLSEISIANKLEALPDTIHNKLITLLKMYLYLGGMPEVLQNYLQNKDIEAVRLIQNELLESYQRDFSKYTDKSQAIKTAELWNSIPYQLAKENKKFKYGDVRKKTRAAHYEQTIEWLKNAGLINVIHQISAPKLPLSGYADLAKFKIYLFDTGLLGALLNISSEIVIKPNDLFVEYNGAFIENFVASELISSGMKELFYWTSQSDAEVDFVIQHNNKIYPLEVKSGNSRNLKSIRSYESKYNPKFIFRTSPRNYIKENEFVNIPLYSSFNIQKIISYVTTIKK